MVQEKPEGKLPDTSKGGATSFRASRTGTESCTPAPPAPPILTFEVDPGSGRRATESRHLMGITHPEGFGVGVGGRVIRCAPLLARRVSS